MRNAVLLSAFPTPKRCDLDNIHHWKFELHSEDNGTFKVVGTYESATTKSKTDCFSITVYPFGGGPVVNVTTGPNEEGYYQRILPKLPSTVTELVLAILTTKGVKKAKFKRLSKFLINKEWLPNPIESLWNQALEKFPGPTMASSVLAEYPHNEPPYPNQENWMPLSGRS